MSIIVPEITNFKYRAEQNFLSKTYTFSWDKITLPYNGKIFYKVYLNNKYLLTTENNYFKVNSGVGCEKKCFKVKTFFKDFTTNQLSYSRFSEELCFTSPSDRYCNQPINLWQNQKISDGEKKIFQQKLEKLKTKKTSSKMLYGKAIKNKTIASSFVPTSKLRSLYYKECGE
tara:strand:+ start:9615 stop:10130 length:516 start_codon:yes stop_codon:yes gene_type:complete